MQAGLVGNIIAPGMIGDLHLVGVEKLKNIGKGVKGVGRGDIEIGPGGGPAAIVRGPRYRVRRGRR